MESHESMHCVALYGKMKNSSHAWLDWVALAKNIFKESGIEATHVGISSEVTFHTKRILAIDRALKRFARSNIELEMVKSFEFYSLPSDYKQAAFDYEAYLVMSSDPMPLILVALPACKQWNDRVDASIHGVASFFEIDSGVIFEMSKEDCPYFYATKMNTPSSYGSLEIIREF